MTVTTVTGAPAAVTVPATTPRTMKMLPDGNSVAQPTTSSNDVATATIRMEARRDRGVRHKKGAPGSLGAEEGTLPPPVKRTKLTYPARLAIAPMRPCWL